MKDSIRTCLDLGLLTVSPKVCPQLIQRPEGRPQNVAVEFSSINIAKPMHMGHFRATVVGNFVRNINIAAGNNVVAINYLGDWGTQFGMLSLGFQKFGDHTLLDKDPLKHLHSVYVQACRTLGDTETGKSDASALATLLENSEDPERLDLWKRFRTVSVAELKKLYSRMNIRFDRYEFESQFVQSAINIVDRLIAARLAKKESDGCVTASSHEAGKRVTLLKSDGGTLYLTRDLAAAISRSDDLKFDRIHYVVEDGQREHFLNLQNLLWRLGYAWAKPDSSPWPLHVRFARVIGASTRHGAGLFLSDVLDAAQREAFSRMQRSPYTRTLLYDQEDGSSDSLPICRFEEVGEEARRVADQMGVTWLVTEMLAKPRLLPVRTSLKVKDGKLGWRVGSHSVADQRDLTGLALQYCHARLCSLEEKAIAAGLLSPSMDELETSRTLSSALYGAPSSRASKVVEEELCAHLATLPHMLTQAYVSYEAHFVFRYCQRLK
ncbi:Arginyl-tRNA synthetase [Sparganum proliferum]